MKYFLTFLVCLVGLSLYAANPSFGDFNANQFGTSGNKVVIKSTALLTNPVVNSGTITGNGSGLTNLAEAALPHTVTNFTIYNSSAGIRTAFGSDGTIWTNPATGNYIKLEDGSVIVGNTNQTVLARYSQISTGAQISANSATATLSTNNGLYLKDINLTGSFRASVSNQLRSELGWYDWPDATVGNFNVLVMETADDDGNSFLRMLRARGTVSSPTAIQSADNLGGISAVGYDGSAYTTHSQGNFGFFANGVFTTTNHGTTAKLQLTPPDLSAAINQKVDYLAFNWGAFVHSIRSATVNPGIIGVRSRGTTSDSAAQADDILLTLAGKGYGSSVPASSGVVINLKASENQTDSAHGSYITFETTPTGSTTRSIRARIEQDGAFKLSAYASATNGVASFSPVTPVAIAATGWTNIWSTNNATVYIDGTDIFFTNRTRAWVAYYTNLAGLTWAKVDLQPGESVQINGTGVTGVAKAF